MGLAKHLNDAGVSPDAALVDAAAQLAFARLTETTAEKEKRRPTLERDIGEARQREQRLADAIAPGTLSDAAPQILLTTLRAEETRRKTLEQERG